MSRKKHLLEITNTELCKHVFLPSIKMNHTQFSDELLEWVNYNRNKIIEIHRIPDYVRDHEKIFLEFNTEEDKAFFILSFGVDTLLCAG